MKKGILGIIAAGFLIALAAPLGNKQIQQVKADDDYVVYKNADLGLEDYGDVYTYNSDGSVDYYFGNDLSPKSELQLRYRNSGVGEDSNYWIGVGDYAVYVSASATIRYLYLNDDNLEPGNANRFRRTPQISNLVMKAEDGTVLTSLMPNGKIFDDYIDATIRFDLTGTYGKVEFSVQYNGKTFYPYNGTSKVDSCTYTAKGNITDNKFRMATANGIGNNGKIVTFKSQDEIIPNEFTNNGEFEYSASNGATGTLIASSKCAAQGVPTGNVGSVLKIVGHNDDVISFNFEPGQFKITEMASIVLRVYAQATVSGTYPEIRLKNKSGSWAFNGTGDFAGAGGYSLKTVANQWYDVVISSQYFINNTAWNDWAASSNPNILGTIDVRYRCPAATDVLYIDSVTINTNSVDDFTHNDQFSFTLLDGASYVFPHDAAYASIPTGGSGTILRMTGTTNDKYSIDYTASEIPLALVNSIDFRIYAQASASGTYPEFRLQNPDYSSRNLDLWPFINNGGAGGYSLVDGLNAWRTLSVNSNTITGAHGWSNFAGLDDPTILGYFQVLFRTNTSSDSLYIDSITLDLKANDNVGPVITCPYNSMTVPASSLIDLKATAFDAQDNRNVAITYDWDGMTFDANNKVTSQGTFNVVLTAKDYYGNTTTKTVQITVGAEDHDAPVINIPYSSITLPTGALFEFDVSHYITDAYDFTYEVVYSNGTMDELHHLLVGTHTMTITATDSSGNSANKVVVINVVDDYSPEGTVIDEQYLDDYAAVYEFCVNSLKMAAIPTSDNTDTGACLNYYGPAKQAYNALTQSQKQIFLTSQDFDDMVDRMCAWAIANGETFDATLGGFSSNLTPNVAQVSNVVIWIAVAVIISFSSFAVVFVIKKRRHN